MRKTISLIYPVIPGLTRNLLVIFFIFLISVIYNLKSIYAIDCEVDPPKGNPDELAAYMKCIEPKISALQSQGKTLQSTIKLLDSQIRLTLAQISSTNAQIVQLQKDIATLSQVVEGLNQELNTLTSVFVARVRENYKDRHSDKSLTFLTAANLSTLQSQIRYLTLTQKRDQIILHELERSRLDYDQQKTTKQQKQAEVEALKLNLEKQQKQLVSQQGAKKQLLAETKNSEARYQMLLEKAVAELEAIEDIIAGKGVETEVKDISAGEIIARVEPYRSDGDYCNSSGPHLHFTVAQDGTALNPFSKLKQIDHVDNSGGDEFNPSGSWDWPLNPTISFNQGFGSTYAIRTYNLWYKKHNGIDVKGSSDQIKAVQAGKLYQGSYAGHTWKTNKPCSLKYVRVHHKDENLDTFYLHVNYF